MLSPAALATDNYDERKEFNDYLKPLILKDMKAPAESNGYKKDFLAWHESFASMLTCKTAKWEIVMEQARKRKEKRIPSGTAKLECDKSPQYDRYV